MALAIKYENIICNPFHYLLCIGNQSIINYINRTIAYSLILVFTFPSACQEPFLELPDILVASFLVQLVVPCAHTALWQLSISANQILREWTFATRIRCFILWILTVELGNLNLVAWTCIEYLYIINWVSVAAEFRPFVSITVPQFIFFI